jgi:alkaline phosphatase D
VGDVTSNSALIWVRTDGSAMVQVEWAPPSLWESVSNMATAIAPVSRSPRVTTSADGDYTATIALEGLVPSTRYRYHILVGKAEAGENHQKAKLAASGEFTTWPDVRTSVPLTFAWSGDLGGLGRCRQEVGGYPVFEVMRQPRPDFFLFLGDTIYGDHVCPSPPNEPGADFTASTLSEYRARHRYQRGAEALRRFLEMVPVYVIWDDHDVKNNFAGPVEPQMPAGRQAFREYWPIVSPQDDPHRMYRTVRYGADLELFILDTRSYRSRNADRDGPTKTMLGQAQLSWLFDGLSASTATWKIIATSVPLSLPKGGGMEVPGNDGWAGGPDGTGFERERQVIVDAILDRKITNVVFLAGDAHYVQANRYDPNGDGIPDFHEFVAGPLSAAPGRMIYPSPALRPTNLLHEGGYQNFGLVKVTASSFDVSILDDRGKVRFCYRLSAKYPP